MGCWCPGSTGSPDSRSRVHPRVILSGRCGHSRHDRSAGRFTGNLRWRRARQGPGDEGVGVARLPTSHPSLKQGPHRNQSDTGIWAADIEEVEALGRPAPCGSGRQVDRILRDPQHQGNTLSKP